ncbi:MAG: hypothetical protein HXX11_00955 [Desulfuromonadales bacterium]|nr:hypothetical protein [Desulfuromonadales bacterium]
MKYALRAVLLISAVLLLASCSNGNGKAVGIDPITGKHAAGWAVAGTGGAHPSAFHANPGACSECHGLDLRGGTSKVSCFSASRSGISCHANGPGLPHTVPFTNHGNEARAVSDFCLGCHQDAANAAGSKPPGCQNCHLTSPVTSPSNCISCHSKPPNAAAYPNSAGSHSSHGALNVVENATLTAGCDQCHSGLGLGTADHQNRSRQRAAALLPNALVFGALATSQSTNATSCDTTWCHGGNTAFIPQNNPVRTAPVWGTPFPVASVLGTGGAAGTSGSGFCAQCHGYPPLTASHAGVTAAQCTTCHSHLNADGLTFNNPAKHVNGVIDVVVHSFPFPGSVPAHNTAVNGAGCRSASCHPVDVAGSAYPVTRGTPPNCRACHLNSSPTTYPHCSGCHGSAANDTTPLLAGRPIGGTTFPNRPGLHNIGNHLIWDCTVCHLITDTSASHGWSGGIRSTTTQIKLVSGLTLGINSWNPATGQCTASCHTNSSLVRTWQ